MASSSWNHAEKCKENQLISHYKAQFHCRGSPADLGFRLRRISRIETSQAHSIKAETIGMKRDIARLSIRIDRGGSGYDDSNSLTRHIGEMRELDR
jgi:hypothetical protein